MEFRTAEDFRKLTDAPNQAYRKMLIENAASDREAVTEDIDGVVCSIPAYVVQ